ncbi:bifunctional 23S rRNA (guanine(2069)-N(7))-methyltransferase RlmK/23S rRNA (guanine(2445)-N(2))-methyltransferase RlmL [Shewanella algae]|uniref:Ribosomal RNA large subunit methyltransferase K/L n=1 Tax=Shewanella algae TaxID=38313 RepID=A0AAD1K974_9GAMM|nr:bifunctional 23S rRNA (guanine(2069)-N(7))-methyltransferase RlmK/23S rRNA (guanine(2445)-N(2))-methyltransferase RlmL [Shewanella algae]MBO2595134.1 bifunctional 23S rRNA (guanine(2069)-N(7))-methyltransferase RlmK/23S rRNA (guanine(2445)-N(2))-methyltransferase RlmL [Shewanella algae]MBO2666488.1 bifunctional 23S rRNA (guanine(2069)-N(7))-methyltransferase RlmK/23S rRNA (guanine(2445)-N(2))-methyltransferase RlmL [Shewanella algae]BCV44955.1 ribosomal RNA large subunit methyltransferase K/L
MLNFFAAAPKGFEYALAQELREFGALEVKESLAGVYFSCPLELAYRITLWTRLASRILLILHRGPCDSAEQLYNAAFCIDWPSHFDNRCTFSIDFHGMGGFIKNTQFGALKIKDAVVDRFREDDLNRPNVQRVDADFKIDAHYRNGQVTIALNFSGPALHQRGYRSGTGEAPLKENLAANMLARAQWDKQTPLLDPFCGSGTVLIEAAMIAADMAPGLQRSRFGFEHWYRHDAKLWQSIVEEAKARASIGKNRCDVKFFGSDIDSRMVALAKRNAKSAGVSDLIEFSVANALNITPPLDKGLLISNPPYGERLGNVSSLLQLYYQFGDKLKRELGGWQVALLCSDIELISSLKLKADKQMKMFNGALECAFNLYTLHANSTRRAAVAAEQSGAEVSDIASAFANRVKKNLKQLDKWARKEGIDSYRLYDADIPEYNVAIDKYLDYVVIQEYAAPASIPEAVSKRRLTDVLLSLPGAIGVEPDKIILKTRERQKGTNQYQRLDKEKLELVTQEYGARFKLNLTDYLDTGLFLDHRLIRKLVGSKANGRDVLNLFAYTGTASVHAGLGGAKSVTTVDMSNTYLNWAKDNFVLNGLIGKQYRFEQGDCLQWIRDCDRKFDLIFIDPPTFSNSKRMEDSFDVQRDHVKLLSDLFKLLNPGGEIIFSNNKRKFKMDSEAMAAQGMSVTNMDAQMLPMDYKRNPHIHNTWLITHA